MKLRSAAIRMINQQRRAKKRKLKKQQTQVKKTVKMEVKKTKTQTQKFKKTLNLNLKKIAMTKKKKVIATQVTITATVQTAAAARNKVKKKRKKNTKAKHLQTTEANQQTSKKYLTIVKQTTPKKTQKLQQRKILHTKNCWTHSQKLIALPNKMLITPFDFVLFYLEQKE
jgi:hypothetical protein